MTHFLNPTVPTAPPQGEEVASFATYAQAQDAVDALSDEGFPVNCLAIVGTDLRQVEWVTGRMTWWKALFKGAVNGLWLGLFFGLLLSLTSSGSNSAPSMSIIGAVLLGIAWGATFQLIGYAATRGRRDFTSTSQVVASRYSILAREYARDAAQELANMPGNLTRGGQAELRAQRQREKAQKTGPTAFGSRPEEEPKYGVRLPADTDTDQPKGVTSTPEQSATGPETPSELD